MSGKRWNVNDIEERFQYAKFADAIIEYDTLERTFALLDSNRVPVHAPVKAMSLNELREIRKKRREARAG